MRKSVPVVAALSAVVSATCSAGALDVLNAQRSKRCEGVDAPHTPLTLNGSLTAAASLLPEGVRGLSAVAQTGYRGTHIRVIHLEDYTSDRRAALTLSRYHCDSINNPAFEDVGVFKRGEEAWIILAKPYPLPTEKEFPALKQNVLALVNRARSESRQCGDREFTSALPLQYSDVLEQAARAHSEDMSALGAAQHEGSDGGKVAERVTVTGYLWEVVGENVSAGQNDAEQLVSGWLESPGHCANIMNPRFVHMGVAFVTHGESKYGVYWTQVFAAPEIPAVRKVKPKPWWKDRVRRFRPVVPLQ
jgi:uncharacterized protein YkwD